MTPAVDLLSIDHEMAWRPWAVAYFFLIGTSVGAALLAVAAHLRGRPGEGRGALMAAAAFAVAAPLPLLADLHQPARFLHFYLSGATESVMWWGSWFLPLYVAGTVALAAVAALGIGRGLEKALVAWVGVFGVAVLAYTAGEMTVVAARPLWHNAGFPLVLTLTALASGAGAAMVFDAARGVRGPGARLVLVASALALVTTGLWLWLDPALARLAFGHDPMGFLVAFIGLGLVLPALLVLPEGGTLLRGLAGLAAMFGAVAFRWELFTGGQLWAKTEAAFYPHASLLAEMDTLRALVGSAGILALAIVAIVILFHVLPPLAGRTTA